MPGVVPTRKTTVHPNAGQSYEVLGLKDLKGIEFTRPCGEKYLEVEGAPFPIEGAPRHSISKHFQAKKAAIELAIKLAYDGTRHLFLPYEQLAPKVKVVYNAFTHLIEHEPKERMVKLWSQVRDLVCFVLHEDLPYRWRAQLFMEQVGDKFNLSEGDKWWLAHQGDFNYDPR